MNDFKNTYQSAVQDMDKLGMRKCHIDASACMDEGRHRRRMLKRMRRTMTNTFSAMCVVFICGFGTVKAADYIENVIKVNQWGFESADAVTMARNDGLNSQINVGQDSLELAVAEEEVEEKAVSREEPFMPQMQRIEPEATEEISTEEIRIEEPQITGEEQQVTVTEGMSQEQSAQISEAMAVQAEDIAIEQTKQAERKQQQSVEKQPEIASEAEGLMAVETEENAPVMTEMPIEELAMEAAAVEEIPTKNYVSWEEFEKSEDIIFPQPSISIGKTIEATDITVCGDWAMVRYDVDGKVLWIERTDYSATQGHASSKVFPGGVCNERTYTTPTGYTYTLIDSVKENVDEPLQIHAAISVGSYEAFIDFMGYTEEDAKKIIDSIDLSVYE